MCTHIYRTDKRCAVFCAFVAPVEYQWTMIILCHDNNLNLLKIIIKYIQFRQILKILIS